LAAKIILPTNFLRGMQIIYVIFTGSVIREGAGKKAIPE
jgi:hypothetical protein